jgi:hypothetical protein
MEGEKRIKEKRRGKEVRWKWKGSKGGYSVSTVRRMKSIFAVLNKLTE